jgi:hypothetical protein
MILARTNEQAALPRNCVRLDGLLETGDQQVKMQLLQPILAGGHRPLKGHTLLNVCRQKREESVQKNKNSNQTTQNKDEEFSSDYHLVTWRLAQFHFWFLGRNGGHRFLKGFTVTHQSHFGLNGLSSRRFLLFFVAFPVDLDIFLVITLGSI